jgi:hypothetical protein
MTNLLAFIHTLPLIGKARPALKPDNITSICERLSRKCESLDASQLDRPPRPVTGIALLYGDGVCFL